MNIILLYIKNLIYIYLLMIVNFFSCGTQKNNMNINGGILYFDKKPKNKKILRDIQSIQKIGIDYYSLDINIHNIYRAYWSNNALVMGIPPKNIIGVVYDTVTDEISN